MEFIEPKGHKKDVWIKSEQLPPDAIGELGRIWGASIRVLCFSPEWGKRWGWHTRLAGKWSVDGVTSAVWCYEQVCLAEMFKFSTNVIGKLAYSTCYSQYGLLSTKL